MNTCAVERKSKKSQNMSKDKYVRLATHGMTSFLKTVINQLVPKTSLNLFGVESYKWQKWLKVKISNVHRADEQIATKKGKKTKDLWICPEPYYIYSCFSCGFLKWMTGLAFMYSVQVPTETHCCVKYVWNWYWWQCRYWFLHTIMLCNSI